MYVFTSNMHMAEWEKCEINTAFDFAITDVEFVRNGLHSIRKFDSSIATQKLMAALTLF